MFKNLNEVQKEVLIGLANNNMDVSKTARKLFRHRNSVVYHLEKVKVTTGLNPFNFYELIKLLELCGVDVFKGKDDINECN